MCLDGVATGARACRLWVLPLDEIDAVQASVPGMHEKLTLGLKKTVRASSHPLCYLPSLIKHVSRYSPGAVYGALSEW